MSCDKSALQQSQGIQGIQGASQSMPADFTAMGTTPKDCVASTTKQLRFVGLNSSKTCQICQGHPGLVGTLGIVKWGFKQPT